MKVIIVIMGIALSMISHVQAGERIRGTIGQINAGSSWIKIDDIKYQVKQEETKIISGEHKLNLDMLSKGDEIYFRSDRSLLITEIKLIHPTQSEY